MWGLAVVVGEAREFGLLCYGWVVCTVIGVVVRLSLRGKR